MAKTNRISLGGTKWFNPDTATAYEEGTTWNGHNHVSNATGSQFDHEVLYLTKGGTYVLHAWSQWQGSRASYRVIDKGEAYEWLVAQGHHDAVPSDVVQAGEI